MTIGLPTLGRPVSLEWANMWKSLNPPINYNMVVAQITGAPVADARNAICKEAIRNESRYIFFLGDDTIPPAHVLRQFILRLENNQEIGVVGGVYCSKSTPPAPLVFRGNGHGSFWDWKIGEFFEVSGLGMDCTMIRTSILKEIPEPWFKTVDETGFSEGENKCEQWTEDLYFLKKVADATNYKIFCDASIICSHVDVFGGKSYNLPANTLPTRQFVAGEDGRTAVDIGCGPLHRVIDGIIPVRVDIREDINPDYRCDVRELPFGNGAFDIVYSSHVLEHFNRSEWKNVLKEWLRLVKTGGKIILNLPNIKWAADMMINKGVIDDNVLNVLYGQQSYPQDFHYNGLTPERVEDALNEFGFETFSLKQEGYNMEIQARRKN